MQRLLAIGLIWLGCAVAWMILGSVLVVRSGEASSAITQEVHQLWGPPMDQAPPRAVWKEVRTTQDKVTTTDAAGHTVQTQTERQTEVEVDAPLEASDVSVRLRLEHRRKGLMWFPTYVVDFRARYAFANPTGEPRAMELRFPLQTEHALYDGFDVREAGGEPVRAAIEGGVARWKRTFAPGERREWTVEYRSRGTSSWRYQLTAGTGQVRGFHLTMDTDFRAVDFPAGTVSPSAHGPSAGGWHGEWTFRTLVANAPIGVDLPQRLNPGPLASRITFFAPVGLLFFFFVVAVFGAARRREIHPLNYFLVGCAFFAFHLLFSYLVDHLPVFPSFAIAAAVSVLLVVSYARLFVGWRFALREVGLAQIVYLVLFSFTFFWTGFTGLAITVGAILTLFVMMQLTGRTDWRALSGRAAAPPASGPTGQAAPGMP